MEMPKINLYDWFSSDTSTNHIKNLSENKLLNITNEINSLLDDKIDDSFNNFNIQLPQLVVVGTQSSGKSSVLNTIITMDILPTGKNMVTRTPLDIRLHKIKSNIKSYVQVDSFDKINITVPIPTNDEISKIRDQIIEKTKIIAGDKTNIGSTPIIIDIYSPFVPNLSLIDLPGLTMVACIDKGQPENIKELIEDLVVRYITKDNSIVLAVMQARTDLETDLGLALIKKHNVTTRSIGIITKPDLINDDNNVGDYLKGNISKSLVMGYGYHVVKNRSLGESDITIPKYLTIEDNYFKSHSEYKKNVYRNNVGMNNLSLNLNKILIESIKDKMPKALEELNNIEIKVMSKLEAIGDNVPNNKEGQMLFMNKYVSSFYYKVLDSINSKSMTINTGKLIKDEFINFRNVIYDIEPFKEDIYSKAYFENIMSNFEGNHMSFSIPPIQILEACLSDSNIRPLMLLHKPSIELVDNICTCLESLVSSISSYDEMMKYSLLASNIVSCITDYILRLKVIVKGKILDKIKDEESYIWTEDDRFKKNLLKGDNKDIKEIVDMLNLYYDSIKYIVGHDVPKIIMNNLVSEIEKSLLSYLIQNIVKEDKLELLKEDKEIDKQRKYYNGLYDKICNIKSNLN